MPPLLFAAAQAVVSPEVLTRAAEHQDWWTFAGTTLALALLNGGVVAWLRRMLRRRAFFRTGMGARVLTWAVAAVEALLLALAGGVPLERAATQALIATATASGGWSWKPKRKRTAVEVAVPPQQEAAP